MSFKQNHPLLTDSGFWVLIGGLLVCGSLLFYTSFVVYPLTIEQKQQVQKMDCKSLKDHLIKHDLIYTGDQELQSQIIGKCLK